MIGDTLVDQFADALIAVTPAAIVLSWSRGAEAMFEWTRQEAVGASLLDLVVPVEQRDAEARRIRDAEATGTNTYEAMRRRKDGTALLVDVSVNAVRDDDGALRCVALSMKDVSHLKYLREAAVLEARFRGVLDAVPDAMVLVNAEGRIVSANREAERLFGYSRDELIGRLVEMLVPERFRERHPSHRAHYAADPRTRPMGAGQDLAGRRRDGSEFPAEISLTRVELPEGVFTSAAIRDVTVHRRVEAQFRTMLEAAPDAIVIVDASGDIVLVNAQAERLFGYARSEMVGKPVEMLVPGAVRSAHVGHRERYFETPRARPMGSDIELHAVRKDGSQFPVEISLGPLQTEAGILVSSAIRDVSQRRATEDALKLAYKELEAFSYSIAHDLRAPLRGMSGFAQILLADYADKLDAEGQDCLQEIRNNSLRMGALIDALLSLSRVSRVELRRDRLDLAALARSVGARCAVGEPDRAVEFIAPEHLWVRADPALARALLENLLGNAWKFTRGRAEARVQLGTTEDGGMLAYFVADNGAGFDPAHAGRLFAPFQRMHTQQEFPGTGIGLATAQRIVQRHGGRIWAESAVGEGARFFFTLPGEGGVR